MALDPTVPDTLNRESRAAIQIPASRAVPVVLERLLQIFRAHPGDMYVTVWAADGETRRLIMPPYRADGSDAFANEVKQLLGPRCMDGGSPSTAGSGQAAD